MPGANLRGLVVADGCGSWTPAHGMRTADGLCSFPRMDAAAAERWEAYLWSKDADREAADGSIA